MPFKDIEVGKEYRRAYFQKNKKRLYTQKVKARKLYFKTHPWYKSYEAAKSRCNNKNNVGYHRYGGRGIKFLLSLEDMRYLWGRDWAERMEWPSIDRIDNNGHYELSNCRFIEMKINARWKNRALSIPD